MTSSQICIEAEQGILYDEQTGFRISVCFAEQCWGSWETGKKGPFKALIVVDVL